MPSKIVQRIERELGMADLVEALSTKLPASDLRSLLLEVYQVRSRAAQESAALAQAERDALVKPSSVSSRDFAAFDLAAFETAEDFDALDLSPVCPLGVSSKLGGTHQNNLLTTIRNVEGLGDSTIAMALEAAQRRGTGEVIRLCASHRVIRLQPFQGSGFTPHFRLFAMVTAGRDSGSWNFETQHLVEHLRVYLSMFRVLEAGGFAIQNPLVELSDMDAIEAALREAGVSHDEVRQNIRAHWSDGSARFLAQRGIDLPSDADHAVLEQAVIEPLRAEFPEATFRVNQARLEGLGYYRGFALRISPQAPDGNRYPVADGGFTDWTARLLANQKERLLISGIGSELVCKKYRHAG
ncbi:hypothetical protein [Paludibaculum fermentans]|uniref:hypothetical protein n=1 Tax=Paludibaculum fermentans TaxID=1473598 RepID=UPI003EBF3AC7